MKNIYLCRGQVVTASSKEVIITAGVVKDFLNKIRNKTVDWIIKRLSKARNNEKERKNVLRACDLLSKKFPRYAEQLKEFRKDFEHNDFNGYEEVTSSYKINSIINPLSTLVNIITDNYSSSEEKVETWISALIHGGLTIPISAILIMKLLLEAGVIN